MTVICVLVAQLFPGLVIRMITVATLFTLLRIIITPLLVIQLLNYNFSGSFWLFFVASLTDFFDGFIARYCDQISFLGACLDPVADKLLLLSCLTTLTYMGLFPVWFMGIALLREIIILGGTLYLLITHSGVLIAPTLLGKCTTCYEMVFFGLVMGNFLSDQMRYYGMCGLVFLLIVSCLQYIWIGVHG